MSEDLKNSLLGTNMTSSQMYGELGYQFNQMGSRMSIATLMENAFNNFAFQTGATMASNPATYALWKIADMIQSTTGGIDVPLATALGTGIVNMPTIDQMLKLGLIGMSTLQNIGGIASAVSSLGSGASLLKAMGISEDTSIIARGASLSQTQSGFTTSQSAYMINQNQSAFADSANMMREQQEKETMQNLNQPEIDIKTIHEDILDMMVILRDTGVRIQDSSITGLTDALSGGR
jgi:membrane peptidoglycan carboxypeptidase